MAVGIKFTSFKIINSFILLVAKFGSAFEFNFIGFSSVIAPPSELSALMDPISKMELAIVGTFKPEEGILKVDGKVLDGSYLFSAEGKVSGEFAFYSWFKGKYAGDFVLTIGGYHPNFEIPAHYPKVERLQFNWPKVKGSNLNIKGSVYFALTSSVLMAGGRLEANFETYNLKASYIIELHFIIAWKPFYYDAKATINIGVSYTFSVWSIRKTIKIDVSANLHIWGPEFSGRANIKLGIVEFEIAFGRGDTKPPEALKWEQFKQSFLPTKDQICSITVTSGLIRQIGQGKTAIWVINPKEFALTTNTVIPAKETETLNLSTTIKENTAFGIASMNLKASEFTTSTHKIIIQDSNKKVVNEQFTYEPIYKNVPVALWGESIQPNLKASSLVKALSGLIIKPRKPIKVGKTQSIDCNSLEYDNEEVENAYQWGKFVEFGEININIQKAHIEVEIKNSIDARKTKNKREEILMDLGFQKEIKNISLANFINDEKLQQAFVKSPIIREVVST
ncbi:DUF6603 domain-containing protein [Nostoc sp.]|uniref:DUF6603 domain-containing protein n=1 Tax=Nostoc sp. TaxID=1180 RepID=UPI002FF935B3